MIVCHFTSIILYKKKKRIIINMNVCRLVGYGENEHTRSVHIEKSNLFLVACSFFPSFCCRFGQARFLFLYKKITSVKVSATRQKEKSAERDARDKEEMKGRYICK